jgi:hypothetical protein
VHEPAYEVVLDDERARVARDPQHVAAALRGEHGTGRVLEQRLTDEDARSGRLEGVGEQRRLHTVPVHGHRHGPEAGRAGDRQHSGVRGRLDEDRCAGRGERAQGGGQRGLAARRDQHLGGGDGAADAPREPLAQLRQPVHRRARPGAGATARPGQGGGHRPFRLQ